MRFYFNDLLDAGLPVEFIGDEPGLREDDEGYYVADAEAFKWWVTLTWALDYLERIGREIEEVHEYQDYIDIAKELGGKGLLESDYTDYTDYPVYKMVPTGYNFIKS